MGTNRPCPSNGIPCSTAICVVTAARLPLMGKGEGEGLGLGVGVRVRVVRIRVRVRFELG
jgi:hypothetical protein